MKILKIKVSLNSRGLKTNIEALKVKKTAKLFITDGGKRIQHESLMKPDTLFGNYLPGSGIYFHIHCLPEDEEKAVEVLTNLVDERLKLFDEQINELKLARYRPRKTK